MPNFEKEKRNRTDQTEDAMGEMSKKYQKQNPTNSRENLNNNIDQNSSESFGDPIPDNFIREETSSEEMPSDGEEGHMNDEESLDELLVRLTSRRGNGTSNRSEQPSSYWTRLFEMLRKAETSADKLSVLRILWDKCLYMELSSPIPVHELTSLLCSTIFKLTFSSILFTYEDKEVFLESMNILSFLVEGYQRPELLCKTFVRRRGIEAMKTVMNMGTEFPEISEKSIEILEKLLLHVPDALKDDSLEFYLILQYLHGSSKHLALKILKITNHVLDQSSNIQEVEERIVAFVGLISSYMEPTMDAELLYYSSNLIYRIARMIVNLNLKQLKNFTELNKKHSNEVSSPNNETATPVSTVGSEGDQEDEIISEFNLNFGNVTKAINESLTFCDLEAGCVDRFVEFALQMPLNENCGTWFDYLATNCRYRPDVPESLLSDIRLKSHILYWFPIIFKRSHRANIVSSLLSFVLSIYPEIRMDLPSIRRTAEESLPDLSKWLISNNGMVTRFLDLNDKPLDKFRKTKTAIELSEIFLGLLPSIFDLWKRTSSRHIGSTAAQLISTGILFLLKYQVTEKLSLDVIELFNQVACRLVSKTGNIIMSLLGIEISALLVKMAPELTSGQLLCLCSALRTASLKFEVELKTSSEGSFVLHGLDHRKHFPYVSFDGSLVAWKLCSVLIPFIEGKVAESHRCLEKEKKKKISSACRVILKSANLSTDSEEEFMELFRYLSTSTPEFVCPETTLIIEAFSLFLTNENQDIAARRLKLFSSCFAEEGFFHSEKALEGFINFTKHIVRQLEGSETFEKDILSFNHDDPVRSFSFGKPHLVLPSQAHIRETNRKSISSDDQGIERPLNPDPQNLFNSLSRCVGMSLHLRKKNQMRLRSNSFCFGDLGNETEDSSSGARSDDEDSKCCPNFRLEEGSEAHSRPLVLMDTQGSMVRLEMWAMGHAKKKPKPKEDLWEANEGNNAEQEESENSSSSSSNNSHSNDEEMECQDSDSYAGDDEFYESGLIGGVPNELEEDGLEEMRHDLSLSENAATNSSFSNVLQSLRESVPSPASASPSQPAQQSSLIESLNQEGTTQHSTTTSQVRLFVKKVPIASSNCALSALGRFSNALPIDSSFLKSQRKLYKKNTFLREANHLTIPIDGSFLVEMPYSKTGRLLDTGKPSRKINHWCPLWGKNHKLSIEVGEDDNVEIHQRSKVQVSDENIEVKIKETSAFNSPLFKWAVDPRWDSASKVRKNVNEFVRKNQNVKERPNSIEDEKLLHIAGILNSRKKFDGSTYRGEGSRDCSLFSSGLEDDWIGSRSSSFVTSWLKPYGRQTMHCVILLSILQQFGIYLFNGCPESTEMRWRQAFYSPILTSHASHLLADPVLVGGSQVPSWISRLALAVPNVFPFDIKKLILINSVGPAKMLIHLKARISTIASDLDLVKSTYFSSKSPCVVDPESEESVLTYEVPPHLVAFTERFCHVPEGRCLPKKPLTLSENFLHHRRVRVKVSRQRIFESARMVLYHLHFLGGTNPILPQLDVEFSGDEGTGLGPTLEFFGSALNASILENVLPQGEHEEIKTCMRKDVPGDLWFPNPLWTDSDTTASEISEFHFVRPSDESRTLESNPGEGLGSEVNKVFAIFKTLGQLAAIAAQDSRVCNFRFHPLFWRLLRQLPFSRDCNNYCPWDLNDFYTVDPQLTKSLRELLKLPKDQIEDLALTYTLPGSSPPLALRKVKNGEAVPVTGDNVEDFVQDVLRYSLWDGIRVALIGFAFGYSTFLPLWGLLIFDEKECSQQLFGCSISDKSHWSLAALEAGIAPDHGMASESKTFKNLLEILSEFKESERKDFLEFCTGASVLPSAGFSGLRPRMRVVLKGSSVPSDNYEALPSVMTCTNYIKMPMFASKEVMKDRLCLAMGEGRGAFALS
eukprot:GHVP01054739.1.p1 GENE.GHVP01054739.1~~GHVP01054739.1.p1  ORF type:complete len:1908 (-),score=336.87 GHVP01054739.1:4909-10632(-)